MLCGELGEDLILKIGEVILFTEKKRVIGGELVQHQLQVRRITGGKQMLQKGAETLKEWERRLLISWRFLLRSMP